MKYIALLLFLCFAHPLFSQNLQLVLPEGHSDENIHYWKDFTVITFSKDASFIATAVGDNVKIWDGRSGKLLRSFSAHPTGVSSINFSHDGRQLATTGYNIEAPYSTVKLWDIKTLTATTILESSKSTFFQHVLFSEDDSKLICTGDTAVLAYDLLKKRVSQTIQVTDGAATFKLPEKDAYVTYANPVKVWDSKGVRQSIANSLASRTSNLLLVAQNKVLVRNKDQIEQHDLGSPSNVIRFKYPNGSIESYNQSADGRYISVIHNTDSLHVWDTHTGRIVLKEDSTSSFAYNTTYGNYLLKKVNGAPETGSLKGNARKKLFKEKEASYTDSYSMFAHDQKHYVVITKGQFNSLTYEIRDAGSHNLLYALQGHTHNMEYATFNKAGTRLFTSSSSYHNQAYDMKTGHLLGPFYVQSQVDMNDFADYDTFVNGRKVFVGDNGISLYIEDAKEREVLSIYPVGNSDYLVKLPDNYYQCTPQAAKLLHYVTDDLKVITFDQLDVKYNRPDKVLKALGNKDEALIQSYRKAYEKRIQKLGIDTTAFANTYSVPEADFKREGISFEQKQDKLTLHFEAADKQYYLDRYQVWVNEVPVFTMQGVSVRNKKAKQLKTSFSVQLSKGLNIIEASVTNVNGIESYRIPLHVHYTPPKPEKEKVYFIGIGINQFADARHNLKWSVKDVRDLAKSLKLKHGSALVVDTLFDQQVTIPNILALKQKLLQTGVNDKVILSYSGHGLLSKEFDYYLSTYHINFDEPQQSGLAYTELENLLDGIPARKKLMLIDACHSGEVDKEELSRLASAEAELGKSGVSGSRGVKTLNTSRRLGMKNSFELMQELFVNVSRSTGATIISAAAGTQFALEKNDLENGVFTYTILELMKQQKSATVTELKQHVNKRVPELTSGLQVPTTRNEVKAVDWNVW